MRITSISASNFRTLEDFALQFGETYSAISGKNNAGKSAIVKIIQYFLDNNDDSRFFDPLINRVSLAKDLTQWSKSDYLSISIELLLDRLDDSEVFFVVQAFSQSTLESDSISVKLVQKLTKSEVSNVECFVNGSELDNQSSSEILKKFRSASNLVTHNSTVSNRNFFYLGDSYTEILETSFSEEDRKKISEAEKGLQTRVRRAAKQHKDDLEALLGRLTDKYQVDLSSINNGRSSTYPLQIKLTDKSVEVPLSDWGAGTQNRTKILMSVLEAIRIRSSVTAENRSTPVFLVEEPESFLHPSAQAEFGQVLNSLADELKIQIIATTHSPYMLNQSNPTANFLLEREVFRGLPRQTLVKDTSGGDWMLPFAENLGIVPTEFASWKQVFGVHSNKVVLVEGDIDKEYFSLFQSKYPHIYGIPADVEIVPYGGKDALKNTSILQFMINKFGTVYVTYDLDADREVRPALERIGLIQDSNFCSIGQDGGAGLDCIEGLLPNDVKQTVYSQKHELVTALGSQDSKARTSAKSKLKQFLLSEFSSRSYNDRDLGSFKKMFSKISKAF